MDEGTLLLALVGAAVFGILAVLLILRRARLAAASGPAPDRPYAASTEGETRCPACGMGNLWTDKTCVACGAQLT